MKNEAPSYQQERQYFLFLKN